jgi:WD40 repeat protein
MHRWQERYEQGEDVSAEVLCRDHPDLADELAERIQALRAMQRFLQSEKPPAERSEHPTADHVADTPLLPPPDGASGRPTPALPGYTILEELGRGGMGVVYKAQHLSLKRVVALKMILAGEYAEAGELRRFQAEAEAIARLKHPNIVQIHEVDEHNGLPYFSLEYCPGGSLDRKLSGTPLPPQEAAALVEVLARAMQAAHEKGIVHRDLKPANVLLGEGGEPKITDFGLAKKLEEAGQTRSGDIMGSPSYMAPEQARGQNQAVGSAVDVYALGAILYECLTGRPPFKAATALETLLQVVDDEPVSPSQLNRKVPRDLETVCLKCLEKEPGRRYSSAGELGEDLRRFHAGEPVRARPLARWGRGVKWVRRNPVLAGLLAAVAVALLGGTAVSMYFAFDAADQAESARDSAADAETKAALAKAKEKEAKESAEDAKAKEKLARDNAAETRRILGEFSVTNGLRLAEQGDLFGGLLWYAEQVQRDPDNPGTEMTARLRLRAYREYGNLPTLVQVFFHEAGVTRTAFSPDGRRVLSASNDKTVLVWELATGKPLSPSLRLPDLVVHGAFTPNGPRVITANAKGMARVWDVATGNPVSPPLKHQGEVYHAVFNGDGRQVVIAGGGAARVWDMATGKPVSPPLKHLGGVLHAAFSPDGRRVVTASADMTARVWDVATGKPVSPPLHPLGRAIYTAFSPDGLRVFIAGDGAARVWDATTGQPVSPSLVPPGGVLHADLSPDERQVVTASADGTARVWDVATGKPVSPPLTHQGWVQHAVFSPDGRRVLTASKDMTARVWDAATGKPVTPPLRHQGTVNHVAFSPDGRRVVTASNKTVRIWDVAADRPVSTPLRHNNLAEHSEFSPDGRRVTTVSKDGMETLRHNNVVEYGEFSPDGRQVVTASADGTARVWDAFTGRPVTPFLRHRESVYHAAFSPDGCRVLTASEDNPAQVWDVATGQPVKLPPIYHATFSPDGRRVLTASRGFDGGEVRVWELATGKPLSPSLRLPDRVVHGAFTPNGPRVITANAKGMARVWDVATGQPVSPPLGQPVSPPVPPQLRVVHAVFSLDGRRVVTASQDKTARVWDVATGQPVSPPLTHQGPVNHAAFSPDGRRVVTASQDKTARVWDVATGKPISPPLTHESPVRGAAYSPDGCRVLTDSGFPQVWDAATGQPVTPPLQHQDGGAMHAAFSPDGREVRTISAGGMARVWDLTPDTRPLDDWLAMTQLWSGFRIDATGALVQLSAEEFSQAWHKLRPRYPQDFTISAEQTIAWHRREMVDCLRERNPAAAVFHAWQAAPEFHLLWAALHP